MATTVAHHPSIVTHLSWLEAILNYTACAPLAWLA